MATTLRVIAYLLVSMGFYANSVYAVSPASSHARHAIKPAPRVTILAQGKVLRGDTRSFTAVATVDRKTVFEAIPAYQQLRREKLSKRDPRYLFLLSEANTAFQRTLDRACRHYGVDLVIQEGNVRAVGLEIVDLTPVMTKAVSARRGARGTSCR